MDAKTTIKNVMESMVCLFVKDTRVDHRPLSKYLKKAALYPVYNAAMNINMSIIITKDNIMKQLISKSPSFLKYLGL